MQAPAKAKRRTFFRFWLPWLIILLAALGVGAAGFSPVTEEWAPVNRFMTCVFIVMLAALLIALWFLLFSSVRGSLRITALLVIAALGFAFSRQITNVKFTGNMVPIVRFWWDPEPDDVLETQRKAHPTKAPPFKTASDQATAFLEYRGSKRDGVIQGPPLARDWKAQPPRQLWRQPVGGGYSGFTVNGNALVTLEQRRDQELIVCYDTVTGAERWTHGYNARFNENMGGPGPRATPTIADGRVYSLGATGMLVCLELPDGRLKWQVDILKDNQNIIWGMSGSPLVLDKVVVVNPGAQTEAASGRALVAYDRDTGKEVWHAGKTKAGYSSPMLVTLVGQKQILLLDGAQLAGYDSQTGQELWNYRWDKTLNGINVAQPLVLDGDRVFISSAYDIGCAMLHVSKYALQPLPNGKPTDGWKVDELWKNNMKLRAKFASPVVHEGFIYGLDEGYLVCLDADGARVWKGQDYGHGQLLLSGGVLVILSEKGKLVLARATPEFDAKTRNELASMQALKGKTWNCFALADGIAYVRNDLEMAAYDLREAEKK
jgi:outer membrane protein assembly factor BamB